MSSQGKKWIIRDGKGHIYGPFEAPKIRELLRQGLLTGEEEACHYPAGDWAVMSTDRDLYDLVLEALAAGPAEKKAIASGDSHPPGHAAASRSATRTDGTAESNPGGLEEPATKIEKAGDRDRKRENRVRLEREREARREEKRKAKKSKSQSGQTPLHSLPPFGAAPQSLPPPPDLVMHDKTKLARQSVIQRNFLPILFIGGAIVLFYFGLNRGGLGPSNARAISLLMPRLGGTNVSASESDLKKGWSYFYKDTYSNYVRAEESFVEAVGDNGKNVEGILMLLQSDMYLWPFAKQDSSDQNTIQNLVQMISQADRGGVKRAIAAATMDATLGHDTSAQTQVDSTLVQEPMEGRLYQMKGQFLFDSGDFESAIGYFEKAATLLSYWVRPIYMIGVAYSHLGNGSEAQKYLLQALKMNSGHAAARLELGIVEAQFFAHEDRGKEYLTVALDGDEKLSPAEEARGRYWLGLLFEKSGNRSQAKKQAERAFQLSPSDPGVRELLERLGEKVPEGMAGNDREHMAMGDQYMRMGNYLGAQAQFKAAFQVNPHNARAAMKAAEALWKFHQSTEAMEFLLKSIKADPKFIESYVLIADYKSQRFDFDGAVKNLEQAQRENPKSYEVYRGFAQVLVRRGDFTEAEAYAQKALGYYEIDVKANVLMSRIQLAKKDLMKAAQYGKRAVDLDKGDIDAQDNYAKVLAAYEGVPSGTAYLTDLINTYPTQIGYRLGLAEILVQDEQYGAAKTVLNQIVEADEKNKEAYTLLGDSYALSDDLNNATSAYISAARIDPSDPTALFRLGEIYLKADKPDRAIEQFNLVLRVNPMYPRAHYNIARAYFQAQLPDKAIDELETEKKMNPKLADPYEFEGDVFLVTRKYSLAAREYQKASEIKDGGAGIFVKMAKAYRGEGAYDEAMAMLKMAHAKESGNSEIYKEYGYLYEAKNMPEEAVVSFETYLRLEPNSPDRKAISDKIDELK